MNNSQLVSCLKLNIHPLALFFACFSLLPSGPRIATGRLKLNIKNGFQSCHECLSNTPFIFCKINTIYLSICAIMEYMVVMVTHFTQRRSCYLWLCIDNTKAVESSLHRALRYQSPDNSNYIIVLIFF